MNLNPPPSSRTPPCPCRHTIGRMGLWLLLAMALFVRFYMYALGSREVPVTSDEALTVLQAVDICNGDFPLLLSAQPYMFPLEAYWMAPLVKILPRTAAGMRVLIVLEGLAFLWLTLWVLRRMGRWREVWPGALWALFPSAYVLCGQTAYSLPHNLSSQLLALAAAGFIFKLDETNRRTLAREATLAFFGAFFLTGAFTNSMSAMGFIAPLTVFALWNMAGAGGRRIVARVLGYVAGGFLGIFPYLLARWTIPGAHGSVTAMYSVGDAFRRLWTPTCTVTLPGTFGWQPCLWPDSDYRLAWGIWGSHLFAYVGVTLFIVALVLAFRRIWKTSFRDHRWPLMGPMEWALGVTAAAVVLFALNRRATSGDFRYLLPAAVVFPFALAGFWQQLKPRPLRAGMAMALVALAGWNIATSLRLPQEWKKEHFARDVVAVPDVQPALDILKEQKIHHAVTSHWAAYRIGFEADGEVMCAQPRNERFSHWPLPYKTEVDAAQHVAYVLTDCIRFLKPAMFERDLRTMNISADRLPAGDFTVYCNFRPATDSQTTPLPADGMSVTASCATVQLPALQDDNLQTFWRTDILQQTNMMVEFAWPRPTELAGIRLCYGQFGHDRPLDLLIQVRRNGLWESPDVHGIREPFTWKNQHPVYNFSSADRFDFHANDVDAIRLTILRPHPEMAWTLCEVHVLTPLTPAAEERTRP